MDFRKIITKMRDLDPTTPGQFLEHYSTLAESTGISLGANVVVTEASTPVFLYLIKDVDTTVPIKHAAKDA